MLYLLSLLTFVQGQIYPNDTVKNLPGWGERYTGAMYSGYAPINEKCHSALFYWMLEKEGGSEDETPVLLWLNGGPGASSITGLLAENIGPYQLSGSTFKYNTHAWTNDYNVLIIDNPVGSGYSYTDNMTGCYSTTESEVAANFYIGLNYFFNKLHPKKYAHNPFFLTGESYAGKYIPSIAAYLHKMGFPFKGVIIGNGLYKPDVQYLTVAQYAFNLGIIDESILLEMEELTATCVEIIRYGDPAEAEDVCEGMVGLIYGKYGGGVFRYDVREFYNVFENVTVDLGKYLNSAEVQSALHTTGHIWTQSDETGPVADALKRDFVQSVALNLSDLLEANYSVVLYNGQMDGSSCNHIGNELVLDDLAWWGQDQFASTNQTLWRVNTQNAIGYYRVYENLAFIMIANAGHLVPMNQPENFRRFLDAAVHGDLPPT